MKTQLLIGLLLIGGSLFAQDNQPSATSAEIKSLEQRIQLQDRQIRYFDQKLTRSLGIIGEENEAIKAEFKSNLEVQAQNERAANLTLDEFSKKFETQNKTMEGVQATLEAQWSKQISIFVILFAVLVIGILVAVKISTQQALKKSKLSWDEFNAYVISGRYKNNA
jgi:maltodextrin utilization protein YvdJ